MLNATLFGQMITFAIFAWVTMKFILPQVNAALEARENEIANGLRAAEEGKTMLVKAGSEVDKLVVDTKAKIAEMLKAAELQAENIVSNAKQDAIVERQAQVVLAENDILQQSNKVKQELKVEVAGIVKLAMEKLLQDKVDDELNNRILEELIVEKEGG